MCIPIMDIYIPNHTISSNFQDFWGFCDDFIHDKRTIVLFKDFIVLAFHLMT